MGERVAVLTEGRTMDDVEELKCRAYAVLVRELGYADAMRFMLLYEKGHGDYTKERHQFLPDWKVEQMVRESDRFLKRDEERQGLSDSE